MSRSHISEGDLGEFYVCKGIEFLIVNPNFPYFLNRYSRQNFRELLHVFAVTIPVNNWQKIINTPLESNVIWSFPRLRP
jgi:hypothetical protein